MWEIESAVGTLKKGCKADPSNSRPVSLTCILCKVFEQILKKHLLRILENDTSLKNIDLLKANFFR